MELKTKLIGGGVLLTAFAGVATVGGIYAHSQIFGMSHSTRSVYNIKFGEKGSLNQTWEGEGTMLTPSEIGGQGLTSTFKFSVPKDQTEVIATLKEAAKNPTEMYSLDYDQVKWFFRIQHDSEYLIKKATKEGDANPYIMGGGAYRPAQTPVLPKR